MWIFSKRGFVSVTQVPKRSNLIQIRARTDTHLQLLKRDFPIIKRSKIVRTNHADYMWRIVVVRWRWKALAAEMMNEIDYSNFKGKVATVPETREMGGTLHDVWDVMNRYQQRKHPIDPMDGEPELLPTAKDLSDYWDKVERQG